MRYRLLPYWYTCFANHSRTAIPILRPVWFEQERVLEEGNMHDQERFMVGDGLLVVPIMEKGKSSIMEPLKGLGSRWYDYFSKKEVFQEDEEIKTGLERIGCFVKGGNVIPTFEIKSDVKSTKDAKESSISLYVALDETDSAKGEVYFDDGETFDYKDGQYARKKINFEGNTLLWEGEDDNNFSVENQVTKVVIMGVKNNAFKNAYLEEENGKVSQKINLVKGADYVTLEFKALANKSWKIILE